MPRVAAEHGTYRAYLRCRKRPEGACSVCVDAKRARTAKVAEGRVSRVSRVSRAAEAPPITPVSAAPLTDEGHVSRVEVLKEMLQESRELVKVLRRSDPQRAYLQMREQREILRELAELQGNGQVKGVTLADQLADARARRRAAASAS